MGQVGGYTVYNLTVEGDHTYFVGSVGGGAWVHNANCESLSDAKILLRKWARDPEKGTRNALVRYHFDEHGDEVGANNIWDYMEQANEARKQVKGRGDPVEGRTPNTLEYKLKGGSYIQIAPGGIISYGARY